mgnify:FL=1
MEFAEWEAAVAAGLNLWDWDQNRYPKQFKVKVLAWYELHNLVQAHIEDARATKANTKARR